MKEEVRTIVVETLKELTTQLNHTLAIDDGTIIKGYDSAIDSLEYVMIVADLEEKLNLRFHKQLDLFEKMSNIKIITISELVDEIMQWIS